MLYDAQWCCKPRMTSRGRPGVPYQGSPIPSHLGRCPGSTYNDNPDRYHPLSMIYILNATRKSCYSYGTTCNLQGTIRGRHPMDFSYHLIQKVSIPWRTTKSEVRRTREGLRNLFALHDNFHRCRIHDVWFTPQNCPLPGGYDRFYHWSRQKVSISWSTTKSEVMRTREGLRKLFALHDNFHRCENHDVCFTPQKWPISSSYGQFYHCSSQKMSLSWYTTKSEVMRARIGFRKLFSLHDVFRSIWKSIIYYNIRYTSSIHYLYSLEVQFYINLRYLIKSGVEYSWMIPGKTTNIMRYNLDLYFITYVQYSVNIEMTQYVSIT